MVLGHIRRGLGMVQPEGLSARGEKNGLFGCSGKYTVLENKPRAGEASNRGFFLGWNRSFFAGRM